MLETSYLLFEVKMKWQPSFRRTYIEKIKDYVNRARDKDFAKKRTKKLKEIRSYMRYLPYFGTSRANKPNLKLVFDAKVT